MKTSSVLDLLNTFLLFPFVHTPRDFTCLCSCCCTLIRCTFMHLQVVSKVTSTMPWLSGHKEVVIVEMAEQALKTIKSHIEVGSILFLHTEILTFTCNHKRLHEDERVICAEF